MKIVNIGKKQIEISTKDFDLVKEHFVLSILTLVAGRSFILVKPFLLIGGKESLKYMETTLRLTFLDHQLLVVNSRS